MKPLFIAACAAALLGAAAASAQPVPPPEQDVGRHHGNIEAAQSLTRQAWDRVSDAQRANHGDTGGHLRRAKELLDEASAEMKAAAEYINSGR
jgi:Spy/CpxP family protein refolding chaperone